VALLLRAVDWLDNVNRTHQVFRLVASTTHIKKDHNPIKPDIFNHYF